jgi:hypothetical protein
MFDKPILIYSDYCEYSKNFIETLMKHETLFDSFIRMNIDVEPNTKKRPQAFYQIQETLDTKITKVPTVITHNAQYILSDINAFKWLEHQIRLLNSDSDELKPFNPNEMSSFSDKYANFGSTDLCDAKEQSFKFFDNGTLYDDNFLQTNVSWDPKNESKTNGFLNDLESSTKNVDYNTKQSERQFFDNSRKSQEKNTSGLENQYVQQTNNPNLSSKYNSYNQQRQSSSQQQQPQRKNIDFTDASFGSFGQNNGGNKGGNNNSQKEKELDTKLEQLMNARENIDKQLNDRPRNY